MQKPIYSAEEEQDLMVQLWSPHISDSIENFVMFAFPWGQKNTPLERFKGPRRWQRRLLREMSGFVVANRRKAEAGDLLDALRDATAAGRGIGKSALVSWLILWMLSTRIGSSVVVSANTENQLRTVTWGELTKWTAMTINSHWWEVSATKLVPAQWLTDLVERDLKKGTRYWGAEGKLWSEENPDGYAGVHNMDGMMLIMDEASGIPDSIWSVAAGFFTENIPDRYWLAFSNGRRNTGYFYDVVEGSKRSFWRSRQIDARTVEGTDKAIYNQIIEEHGEDSDQARVEVYGQFPRTGDDQFISQHLVEEAAAREPFDEKDEPVVIGVDPARGGDWTVIAVRQGRTLLAVKRHKNEELMGVVGLVIEAIREYDADLTIVDEGGLGGGVLDRLAEQRVRVRGVNFGERAHKPMTWGNRRAEIWGEMRDWLKTASIPDDRILKTDLCGPKKKPNSSGVMYLESKRDMRARRVASPDSADALAISLAYPVDHVDVLQTSRFRLWPADTRRPPFEFVVQSYDGAFTEDTMGDPSACTVWGVFTMKGKRHVMLIDAWDELLSYPQLRRRAVEDYSFEYGADVSPKGGMPTRGRRPDKVLVNADNGKSLVYDLKMAGIPVVPYNPTHADRVARAHQAAPTLNTGLLWIPESVKTPGTPVSWASVFIRQLSRFPYGEHDDYVETFTQTVNYLKNDRWLDLPVTKGVEDPYPVKKETGNPYSV